VWRPPAVLVMSLQRRQHIVHRSLPSKAHHQHRGLQLPHQLGVRVGKQSLPYTLCSTVNHHYSSGHAAAAFGSSGHYTCTALATRTSQGGSFALYDDDHRPAFLTQAEFQRKVSQKGYVVFYQAEEETWKKIITLNHLPSTVYSWAQQNLGLSSCFGESDSPEMPRSSRFVPVDVGSGGQFAHPTLESNFSQSGQPWSALSYDGNNKGHHHDRALPTPAASSGLTQDALSSFAYENPSTQWDGDEDAIKTCVQEDVNDRVRDEEVNGLRSLLESVRPFMVPPRIKELEALALSNQHGVPSAEFPFLRLANGQAIVANSLLASANLAAAHPRRNLALMDVLTSQILAECTQRRRRLNKPKAGQFAALSTPSGPILRCLVLGVEKTAAAGKCARVLCLDIAQVAVIPCAMMAYLPARFRFERSSCQVVRIGRSAKDWGPLSPGKLTRMGMAKGDPVPAAEFSPQTNVSETANGANRQARQPDRRREDSRMRDFSEEENYPYCSPHDSRECIIEKFPPGSFSLSLSVRKKDSDGGRRARQRSPSPLPAKSPGRYHRSSHKQKPSAVNGKRDRSAFDEELAEIVAERREEIYERRRRRESPEPEPESDDPPSSPDDEESEDDDRPEAKEPAPPTPTPPPPPPPPPPQSSAHKGPNKEERNRQKVKQKRGAKGKKKPLQQPQEVAENEVEEKSSHYQESKKKESNEKVTSTAKEKEKESKKKTVKNDKSEEQPSQKKKSPDVDLLRKEKEKLVEEILRLERVKEDLSASCSTLNRLGKGKLSVAAPARESDEDDEELSEEDVDDARRGRGRRRPASANVRMRMR